MKELIELLRYTEVNGDRDPQNYVTNLCGRCYLCEQAADALERLEKQVQKWIPVAERLPEEDKKVLILCKNGAMFVGVRGSYYGGTESRFKVCTALASTKLLNKGRVTHWMPLPQPPKGE